MIHDALNRHGTGALLRLAGLVMLALLARLVAVPLVVAAVLADRLVSCVDSRLTTPRPSPPSPPRWAAANTRTRHTATV